MNDKVKEVFELLGVEPEEKFKIENKKSTYYFDDKLHLWYESEGYVLRSPYYDLSNFLNDDLKIIKLQKRWTEEEKTIARYWKLMGAKYIAKDSCDNGNKIFALLTKPLKDYEIGEWAAAGCDLVVDEISYDMPNLSWNDDEPTLIEDILKEE